MQWKRTTTETNGVKSTTYASPCGAYRIVKDWRNYKTFRTLKIKGQDKAVYIASASLAAAKAVDLAKLDAMYEAKLAEVADGNRQHAREQAASVIHKCKLADSKRFIPGVHKSWFEFAEKFVGCTGAEVAAMNTRDDERETVQKAFDLSEGAAHEVIGELNAIWGGWQREFKGESTAVYRCGEFVVTLDLGQCEGQPALRGAVTDGYRTRYVGVQEFSEYYLDSNIADLCGKAAAFALADCIKDRYCNFDWPLAEMVDEMYFIVRDLAGNVAFSEVPETQAA